MKESQKRVMAIASGGGHWVQLSRLSPAWDGCDLTYVTTNEGYRAGVLELAASRGQPAPQFFAVSEANRWQKARVIKTALQIAWLIVRIRPHVIVSTGAAPGAIALRIGSLLGCRTIWVDSIANAETMSMSGQKVAQFADLCLTQWQHLEQEDQGGPRFRGSVL